MTNRELIGISFSPWTEKARWALDHHKLPYKYNEHLILFGMPSLYWKMRKLSFELTVPALVDGDKRVMDSFEIARHADTIGQGTKLFPQNALAEIRRFNELSEKALDAGRAFVMVKTTSDPEAQKAALPPFIPKALRGVARPLVAAGISYIDRAFKVRSRPLADYEAELRSVLEALKRALADSSNDHVLGAPTFADIAMAVALQVVEPVSDEYIRLRPATRRTWTNPELAREYRELLEWRDRMYARYRRG